MLTRKSNSRKAAPGTWKLQDAKARFSEVVRLAQTKGPQRVTVHGKDAVVIVSADDFAEAQPADKDKRTGADLIAAMQEGRRLGLRLKPFRYYATARPPVDFSDDEK
jgi:prevent-host-death family protein